MLAKLFTQPFNFLVLDEPTNDLDYETLELLEQLLMDYAGTLLLVSHDRTFLDNVVTSTIAFEGDGNVHEYIGGYKDWLKQKRQQQKELTNKESKPKDVQATALTVEMSKPEFYQQDPTLVAETGSKLKTLQEELEQCFTRWEELEE